MQWLEALNDQRKILAYYESLPNTDVVDIESFALSSAGPSAAFSVLGLPFPDKPSKRWSSSVNAVLFTFDLIDVARVKILDWSCSNRLRIQVTQEGNYRLWEFFHDATASISLLVREARLRQLTPFIRDSQ